MKSNALQGDLAVLHITLIMAVYTLETGKSSKTDKSSWCENGTDTILDVQVV